MDNEKALLEAHLLAVIHQFLTEMDAHRATRLLTVDASLERDLGIDSLAKVELIHRIEQQFDVQIAAQVLAEANHVNDLITAVAEATPTRAWASREISAPVAASHIDPTSVSTLTEVLTLYASNEPDRPHVYFQDEQGDEITITYGELFQQATRIAQSFAALGINQGETIAIMLPSCPQFFYVFMGVLLCGAVPVPIYPPFRPDQIEEYAKREALILSNAEVRLLITFERAEILSKLLKNFIPSLKAVFTFDALAQYQSDVKPITIHADDSALIQYTSGSTGAPKGVLLNHHNLITNLRAGAEAINLQTTDVMVTWLPLYHDMGLIGTWLGSMYHGIPVVSMSPLTFLSRPERWLWAIHYHRATISAGPNFAYELCLRRIADKEIEGLDLSSWRVAFNGAEAIYPETLREFSKRFKRYGFRNESIYPVYGLAESTVALVFPPIERGPVFDVVQRELFERKNIAKPAESGDSNGLEFVAVGQAIPGHNIQIVDPDNQPLTERHVGHIQFQGPSSMQGYYRNPEATQAVYHQGWWDTGDLGYQAGGDLFITGRVKDVIIKAGRNLYPAEVEEIVGQLDGVRTGCVAAFGVSDAQAGTEKFIVVAETRATDTRQKDLIHHDITEQVAIKIGVPADLVILVPARTIPKTSSGKLRRSSCKQDYLDGKMGRHGAPTWLQLVKLTCGSAWKMLRKWCGRVGRLSYSLYAGTLIFTTILMLCGVNFLLSPVKARKLTKLWTRLMLRCVFCPVKIIYEQTASQDNKSTNPVIYVANHASYVDSFLLIAILPSDTLFIGKKELLNAPILKTFIKQLGYMTVDRFDVSQSVADSNTIIDTVEAGNSIMIFPEGTFTYASGLRPFKLGAFKTAMETSTALCPIALQGTRKILRAGQSLPRPAKITVTIGEAIVPQANNWQEVTRLRNEVRAFIAKHCGEKTLALVRAGMDT